MATHLEIERNALERAIKANQRDPDNLLTGVSDGDPWRITKGGKVEFKDMSLKAPKWKLFPLYAEDFRQDVWPAIVAALADKEAV